MSVSQLPPDTIKRELKKFLKASPALLVGLDAGADICAWVPALERFAFVCSHRSDVDLYVLLLTEAEAADVALKTMPATGGVH